MTAPGDGLAELHGEFERAARELDSAGDGGRLRELRAVLETHRRTRHRIVTAPAYQLGGPRARAGRLEELAERVRHLRRQIAAAADVRK
jgi:hypothetical protein